MKKVYSVELETEQIGIEPFWMYRGFGYDKSEAEKCAKLLSSFFPYDEYPTKIILYVEDENDEGHLKNKTVLKEYFLKNEDGMIVKKTNDL
ncbi:hypothetical protein EV196_11344 [Mariniflexile fucanivorans]|uniref:Uncharacterized protein n=1 Tax=Mariniflexile fucanivorans TaxID=264023 RepID=A0A4R1RAR2_9FLAO|nr:hypothetical protein [Mariniflexile fucanivorans]TCL62502.1 hypothetical protein EV196_11344 [Mariniflexile fucanivorans]